MCPVITSLVGPIDCLHPPPGGVFERHSPYPFVTAPVQRRIGERRRAFLNFPCWEPSMVYDPQCDYSVKRYVFDVRFWAVHIVVDGHRQGRRFIDRFGGEVRRIFEGLERDVFECGVVLFVWEHLTAVYFILARFRGQVR